MVFNVTASQGVYRCHSFATAFSITITHTHIHTHMNTLSAHGPPCRKDCEIPIICVRLNSRGQNVHWSTCPAACDDAAEINRAHNIAVCVCERARACLCVGVDSNQNSRETMDQLLHRTALWSCEKSEHCCIAGSEHPTCFGAARFVC